MLLEMCHFTGPPKPQALLWFEAHRLPLPTTTTCKAVIASQSLLECGNKRVNVQDLAAFLLVYKLFEK